MPVWYGSLFHADLYCSMVLLDKSNKGNQSNRCSCYSCMHFQGEKQFLLQFESSLVAVGLSCFSLFSHNNARKEGKRAVCSAFFFLALSCKPVNQTKKPPAQFSRTHFSRKQEEVENWQCFLIPSLLSRRICLKVHTTEGVWN